MESEGDKGAHELVTSLAWIADGVDELEDDPVEVLMEMGRYEPELAIHYIGMQWFSDGLTEDEAGAFLGITYIDYFVADESNQISELAWVSDGITLDEAWAVHGVGGIAFEDENARTRLFRRLGSETASAAKRQMCCSLWGCWLIRQERLCSSSACRFWRPSKRRTH